MIAMFLKRLILLLVLINLVACNPFAGEEEATPVAIEPITQQQKVVSAEAFVVPVRQAKIAFEVSGKVVDLPVHEGDVVKAGDVLVQLDDTTAQAALAEVEASMSARLADLVKAEAELSRTQADPKPEEIAQLEAALAKAEAILAERLSGPTAEEIAQSEAAVRTSRAELNQVLAGSRNEDIQRQAAVVMQKEATVRERQSDYDRVRYGDPKDVAAMGTALQQATLDYEASLADYEKLINGNTEEAIAIQQSRVAEQEAGLAKVLAGSTAEQVAQVQADVAQAEANLANLLAGATEEDIAVAQSAVGIAQANVEAAKAQVARSQADLQKYQVKAPFDGMVGSVAIELGETVNMGTETMTLGDTTTWQIETDDLTEIDIVNVHLGQSVTIKVDALPDAEYTGEVVRMTPRSETKAGDVTYTVLIEITGGDTSKLMWGMTTFVDITVE